MYTFKKFELPDFSYVIPISKLRKMNLWVSLEMLIKITYVCMYGIQELISIEIAKSILSLISNSLTHDLRMHLTL